jgi:hypothetical protein
LNRGYYTKQVKNGMKIRVRNLGFYAVFGAAHHVAMAGPRDGQTDVVLDEKIAAIEGRHAVLATINSIFGDELTALASLQERVRQAF